jgi:carbonic anhydrase
MWLRKVRAVFHFKKLLVFGGGMGAAPDRLCELNVIHQAVHVAETTIVQDAWARGRPLTIHGWLYSLRDGLLRDTGFCVQSLDAVEPTYERAIALVREAGSQVERPATVAKA